MVPSIASNNFNSLLLGESYSLITLIFENQVVTRPSRQMHMYMHKALFSPSFEEVTINVGAAVTKKGPNSAEVFNVFVIDVMD